MAGKQGARWLMVSPPRKANHSYLSHNAKRTELDQGAAPWNETVFVVLYRFDCATTQSGDQALGDGRHLAFRVRPRSC